MGKQVTEGFVLGERARQPPDPPPNRKFLLAIRQGLMIQLAAIEDTLGMKRSIEPKHLREGSDQ